MCQVGISSRTGDDPEGGELAQFMRSLGEGAENGTAVRYEKGDKVGLRTQGSLICLGFHIYLVIHHFGSRW